MRAPSLGRAVPVKTPQAAVCGEFPISHRPTIGSATEIKSRICGSSVNSFPHIDFRTVVKTKAESPKPNAMVMPIMAVHCAREGWPAPKAWPTRVVKLQLNANGNTYNNAVV
ncbi:hypothetical protein CISIN_1g033820mg [Citrus sinensis]|uniref:Uncharacterized protein n=1 Tax=Citrus sinensis TaxID=2711 RepID=A0A067E3S3_CITSI|nr:hypothetical protein CISIN_1g033820mg [Citrus sinensis]KDO49678.1 hypothetical protein CISIN_1g033820mg [Citrus sinensis]